MAYDINELIISDEMTQRRIADGIEKNRKGNFTINLRKGSKIHVRLTKHKFRFGANIFMLDEIPDKERNEIYKEKFKELFNMATLPFYWDATEPQKGQVRYSKDSKKIYRRPPIDLCLEFCLENGIEPREHGLCYEHFFPQWMRDYSIPEIKSCLERRMQEISSKYAEKIRTIEVTNEMLWKESATAIYYDPNFVEYCYKLAEKYFPNNEIVINEWSSAIWNTGCTPWDAYYQIIENTLRRGARIDAIGMQYHMFFKNESYLESTRRYYDLSHVFRALDNYAAFERPLQITEVTIPCFTENPEDEESQADVIERLYSLWFSYRNVEQIIYWNLADGYAAFTEPGNMDAGENYYRGGLLRYDMSEKPSFKRLKDLIYKKWTTDLNIEAVNGKACFRGFYGEYEITVNNKLFRVNFDTDGKIISL